MRLSAFRTSLHECRAFANTFHDRLPPELRNLVYSFAWTAEAMEKASQKWHDAVMGSSDTAPWLRKRSNKLFKNFHWKRMTLWTLPPFVGLDIAKEAAAVYYSKLPASIVSGSHIHLLEKFLTVDHLFLDITPADHIRHLNLTISPNQCGSLSTSLSARQISSAGLSIVQRNLKALRKLRFKNDFRLTITIVRDLRGPDMVKVVQAIGPICRQLKADGVKIIIWGYPDQNGRHCFCDVTAQLENSERPGTISSDIQDFQTVDDSSSTLDTESDSESNSGGDSESDSESGSASDSVDDSDLGSVAAPVPAAHAHGSHGDDMLTGSNGSSGSSGIPIAFS